MQSLLIDAAYGTLFEPFKDRHDRQSIRLLVNNIVNNRKLELQTTHIMHEYSFGKKPMMPFLAKFQKPTDACRFVYVYIYAWLYKNVFRRKSRFLPIMHMSLPNA